MIIEITTAPQSILSGIRTTLGSVGLTAQETIRGEKLFTDNALLSSLTVIGTLSTYNDGIASNWNTAYTLVCSNSSYWNAGGQLNFNTLNDYLSTNSIKLGGETSVLGNLTVLGLISSLSSVTVTEIQGISISTSTSGISITGDALFTGGVILSSGVNLFDLFATPTGAVKWDSNYTTTNANSGNWSSVYTTVCSNSASWQSVYAVTSTLYLSQSGGTINGSLYINTSGSTPGLRIANVGSADCFIVEHGSVPNLTPFVISEQGLVGIGTTTPVNDLDVRSNVGRAGNVRADGNLSASRIFSTNNQSNSDFWHSTYTTFGTNSANYVNREFVDGKFLPLSGGNISGNLTTSGTLSTRNIIVADGGSIVGQTSASTFSIGYLTAREINLLHTPYNDGIDPVINIGEFDFDGIYGTRVRYDEINGRTIITGELGTSAPATTAVIIDIVTGNVGVGGLPSSVPGDELTVYGNVSASGLYRGSLKYISVSSNFVAQADASYLVSTVLSGVTATLPTAPFNGDTIRFNDAFSTWNTRNFVVSSANNKIAGLFEPLVCNVANVPFYLTFTNSLTGWRLAFDATNITGSFNTPPSGSITSAMLANNLIINGLTITGNISGNNLRTSFNLGSATGDYSFAVGNGRAFGLFSHAEGQNTIASGDYSHAEGFGTTAGDYSHAEGFGTTASGFASHTEGAVTRATGAQSHSEGNTTHASGEASHAEGQRSEAKGNTSHAAGWRATAAQDYTYAWSDGNLATITQNVSTTRTGQYMVSASGGVYIPGRVGIGTDSIANALTVVGDISASGSIISAAGTIPTVVSLSANRSALGDPTTYNMFFDPGHLMLLESNKKYEIEYNIFYSKTTTGNMTFALSGSRSFGNVVGHYMHSGPTAGLATVGGPSVGGTASSTGPVVTLPILNNVTNGLNFYAKIHFVVDTNSTANAVFAFTSSSGTITPLRGSSRRLTLIS